jgi:hypothetical protein
MLRTNSFDPHHFSLNIEGAGITHLMRTPVEDEMLLSVLSWSFQDENEKACKIVVVATSGEHESADSPTEMVHWLKNSLEEPQQKSLPIKTTVSLELGNHHHLDSWLVSMFNFVIKAPSWWLPWILNLSHTNLSFADSIFERDSFNAQFMEAMEEDGWKMWLGEIR